MPERIHLIVNQVGDYPAAFRDKYAEVKSGVGCLNFRDLGSFTAARQRLVVKGALAPSAAILAHGR